MTFGQTATPGPPIHRSACLSCRSRVLVAVTPAGDEVDLEPAPDPAGDHLVTRSRTADPRPQAARLHPRQADGAVAAGNRLHLAHAPSCPARGRQAQGRHGFRR